MALWVAVARGIPPALYMAPNLAAADPRVLPYSAIDACWGLEFVEEGTRHNAPRGRPSWLAFTGEVTLAAVTPADALAALPAVPAWTNALASFKTALGVQAWAWQPTFVLPQFKAL